MVTLCLVYAWLMRGKSTQHCCFSVFTGLVFGGLVVFGMMTPVPFAEGVIFDGQSIILGVAGLFGGPLVAVIAALIAVIYRVVWIGGSGMLMGVGVIITAATIGCVGHRLRRTVPWIIRFPGLLMIGMSIHVVMFFLTWLLPVELSASVVRTIGWLMVTIYPAGFVLVAMGFAAMENYFQTESALRRSEARHRALVDAIPDMIFVFSKDGTITDFHARDHDDLVLDPALFLGKKVDDVLPRHVVRQTHDAINHAVATGGVAHYEYQLEIGGKTRYFEARLIAGSRDDFVANSRDITERIEAARQLRESREMHEDLIASTMAGIYRIRQKEPLGPEGRELPRLEYEFVSDRYCEITGIRTNEYKRSERPTFEIIHPEDQQSWLEANLEAIRKGEVFKKDVRIQRDGECRWLHFESRPRAVGNGEVIWTGVVLDITEQWRTEEAKQRMERDIMELQKLESLGTLAGGMAHDFNNILTAVQGYAELALHELEDGSPLRGHMVAILEASARATQISRQMLAYSGRGRFLLEPVDLAAMARECADAIRHSADDGIRIAMLSKPVPVMVEADAVQIRQSLINLRNASSSRFSRRNSPGGDLDCPRCLGLSARTMVRSG